MPAICEFLGFKVYIYFFDHSPPHIHMVGQGFRAILSIPEGKLLAGTLPRQVRRAAEAWIEREVETLLENWRRAQAGERLVQVNPPEKER